VGKKKKAPTSSATKKPWLHATGVSLVPYIYLICQKKRISSY